MQDCTIITGGALFCNRAPGGPYRGNGDEARLRGLRDARYGLVAALRWLRYNPAVQTRQQTTEKRGEA